MSMRILTAIGGNPWSDAALNYPVELSRRFRAALHVLTILTPTWAIGVGSKEAR